MKVIKLASRCLVHFVIISAALLLLLLLQDDEIVELKAKMDSMAGEFGEMLRVGMFLLLCGCGLLFIRDTSMCGPTGNPGEDAREDRGVEQQLRGPGPGYPAAHGGAQGVGLSHHLLQLLLLPLGCLLRNRLAVAWSNMVEVSITWNRALDNQFCYSAMM